MSRQLANINGDLLRWARETMNLDMEIAAKKIGVKTERLSECEANKASLTINQLRIAANVYKRPLAAFYLPEPPKDFYVPHDYRRVPGGRVRPLSAELITAIRTALYHRTLACELAETADEPVTNFVGSASLTTPIDLLAKKIRKLLDISLDEQKSWNGQYDALNIWKDAIERAGVLVFHFTGVAVDEARAFSISEQPFPVISINGSDSPNGRVFSIFHELGHLYLGHGGTCDFQEGEETPEVEQSEEVFCNALAGAILVPTEDLQLQVDVKQASARSQWQNDQLTNLARLYSVSSQVILRRLFAIGKTSKFFYQDKQKELITLAAERKKNKGFISVPQRVIRAVGQPFLRIVLSAYRREVITSSDLAEYIGARLKHLPSIESRLMGRNLLTGSDM
jgi:Zn-dependent peptidase ImmA (M78 family)